MRNACAKIINAGGEQKGAENLVDVARILADVLEARWSRATSVSCSRLLANVLP